MLTPFGRPRWLLALALVALSTSACGRIAVPAPPVVEAPSAAKPMATDLPSAVSAARAAMKDAGAQPLMIAAYGVTSNGRLADSTRSGWALIMKPSRGDGTAVKGVALFWNGEARVVNTKAPAGLQVAPLMPSVLPPMKQAVSWAREAGLPKAPTYQVCYLGDAHGPAVAVAERAPANADPMADQAAGMDERKIVILDPSTGKAFAPVTSAEPPSEAPPAAPGAPVEAAPAPEPEADSPEGATALAALVVGARGAR